MSLFNNAIIGASGQGGYRISRSVRLRSSASAYFNRTFGAGSQTTWTFSAWVKLGTLGTDRTLLSCGSGATDSVIYFQGSTNQILLNLNNVTYRRTTQVFRDPSAWYHIVVVLNTSNATAQNRLRLYINGAEVTDWALNSTVALNATPSFNSAIAHNMARYISGASLYFDGYMTEINFIDGQALTPSSFGETNSQTGVWQPKRYAGTYGTNGFYLNFSDNSGVTATTIGKDYSGNGNNWTPNNISITTGATYDSMLDVPTPYADGGNGRGNYATLNAVDLGYSATLSEANLKVSTASSGNAAASSTMAMTGNTYWEVTIGSNSQVGLIWGRASDAYGNSSISMFASGVTGSLGNATRTLSATPSWSNGDTLGLAWNSSTRVLTLYQAGSATAVMTMLTPATGDPQAVVTNYTSGSAMSSQVNFGQRPFTYTPPTGFVALNTQNLPTPTISKGNQYMDVVLYTGNAVQDRAITGFGFDLDLAWIKSRNNAGSHVLVNSVVGGDKQLFSNLTNAEQTNSDMTNGFTTGGILVGDNITGTGSTNQNTYTYALWGWNAGGSTVTNTSGTISAQVRANATAGFSVVTYTGNGTGGATVGHGLGVAPRMVIVKPRAIVDNWNVYHASNGASPATQVLYLNLTNATSTNSTIWNNTAPTSSVFSIGTNSGINTNGSTYVAYCFAAVAGYSAFGSYTGNGSADGPFVYLGFRPRWVMIKSSSLAGSDWAIWDTSRDPYNIVNYQLIANGTSTDATPTADADILSNGFKPRRAATNFNSSGATYIYMAFAENPFKLSLAR